MLYMDFHSLDGLVLVVCQDAMESYISFCRATQFSEERMVGGGLCRVDLSDDEFSLRDRSDDLFVICFVEYQIMD